MKVRTHIVACALAALLAATGCAGAVTRSIVATRNHQGDIAYDHGNLTDASLAYRLALQLDATDEHARAGLASVKLKLAAQQYRNAKFEDALASLAVAQKYDPTSVRLAQLRAQIEAAQTNKQIVVSNYPTYRETGFQIRRSYAQLKTLNGSIIAALQHFDYTYDANQLSKAISDSYLLNSELSKLTNRLINFRALVESGAPHASEASAQAPAGSLLPLP